ncbi:hypothetical protein AVEN_145311-1 [Araneus ventricosus]|uniref:Uncharacterized protein n=1 Tax=Araneus ventricosus TaxID=182803 RepID=A0A4Y2X8L2_ARAVE|nr:hypothetical protein AVEN_229624-1 [Araneus ventricosus]GBO45287.1 hypothetical protein AVEN_145311-1 [Araneus ventricosus]
MELEISCEVKLSQHFPSGFLELQRKRRNNSTTLESLENDETLDQKYINAVQLTQSNSGSITSVRTKMEKPAHVTITIVDQTTIMDDLTECFVKFLDMHKQQD